MSETIAQMRARWPDALRKLKQPPGLPPMAVGGQPSETLPECQTFRLTDWCLMIACRSLSCSPATHAPDENSGELILVRFTIIPHVYLAANHEDRIKMATRILNDLESITQLKREQIAGTCTYHNYVEFAFRYSDYVAIQTANEPLAASTQPGPPKAPALEPFNHWPIVMDKDIHFRCACCYKPGTEFQMIHDPTGQIFNGRYDTGRFKPTNPTEFQEIIGPTLCPDCFSYEIGKALSHGRLVIGHSSLGGFKSETTATPDQLQEPVNRLKQGGKH